MSTRDDLAAKAMPVVLMERVHHLVQAYEDENDADGYRKLLKTVASIAYDVADEMMKEEVGE